jgi:two-component system osmolarity sensor histidine kinase EnvZ
MKNPFNTLFGRLSLMTVGLVVLMHISARITLNDGRDMIDTAHTRRDILAAVRLKAMNSADAAGVAQALGVRYVNADRAVEEGCPAPCSHANTPFDHSLLKELPAGSRVVSDGETGSLWVRYGNAPYWMCLSNLIVLRFRFIGESAAALILALVVALIAAWRFQRPMTRLAEAARRFRSGRPTAPVKETGAAEIRSLIADFNAMMQGLSLAEQERALLLAGIAHDLKAPITRMQLRVSLMNDEERRAGFARDAESLSNILAQFLEHSRESAAVPSSTETKPTPLENVDEHCRANYGGTLVEEGIVKLHLTAGDGFMLATVDLDRIMSNLFENALNYGESPVEISTRCVGKHYLLVVRDHGAGVEDEQIREIEQPFARAAGAAGKLHYGLGLSVVKRLVRQNEGEMECQNAADGGFVVMLSFPV